MCNQCEVLNINGINCHEINCPDSWKDYTVTCEFCGTEFTPEYKGQEYCSQECYQAYWF